MPNSLHDHSESLSRSSNHTPTKNTTPREEMVETAPVNDTRLFRTSIGPDTKADQDPTSKTTMISQFPRSTLQFEDGDVGNPRNWSARKKCGIGCFVLLSAFVATIGTPIYIAGIPHIKEEFNISTTLAISPVSLYAIGLGIGACIATAICEVFGRTIVFKVSLPLSLIFTIVGGAAKNFRTLAVARSLAGLFAGPFLTVGVGTINDLWNVSLERTGTAFALLIALAIIWATQIGPMVSGALITHHSWRWTFWVPAILIGVTAAASFFIPETYEPQILRTRARKANLIVTSRRASHLLLISVGRPLHMIFVEPIVFPAGLILSIFQSMVFAYIIYAILFEDVYKFTEYQVGIAFSPLLVGAVLALPVVAVFDKVTYQKARIEAIRLGTVVAPEKRLYPAMLASITFPASVFWLAWTGRRGVHWIAPTLSGVLFGLSFVLNQLCLSVYLNDVYTTHYGASVFAACTFMRFMVSSAFPLFTVQMVHKLGFAWATSLIAFVTVGMIPIPWVFFRWGPYLRSKSRYIKV